MKSLSCPIEPPDLVLDSGNLPATARELRDLMASAGDFFDRGGPVKVVLAADGEPPRAVPLTACAVVVEAHRLCRPLRPYGDGLVPVTLPDRVARMYLVMAGEWNLRPLTRHHHDPRARIRRGRAHGGRVRPRH
jgi:hypothetical protein